MDLNSKDSASTPGKRHRKVSFFYLLVAAFLFVHLKFEYQFHFVPGSNPFDKFVTTDEMPLIEVAKRAYLAKLTWLLLTIILVSFRLPVRLAVGIGATAYGSELLVFFGSTSIAWGCVAIGIGVIVESYVDRRRQRGVNNQSAPSEGKRPAMR